MFYKSIHILLICLFITLPITSFAKNYPCSGKKGEFHIVHLMGSSFAMMERQASQRKYVLKTKVASYE